MEGDLQGEDGKRGWEDICRGRSGGEDGRGPAQGGGEARMGEDLHREEGRGGREVQEELPHPPIPKAPCPAGENVKKWGSRRGDGRLGGLRAPPTYQSQYLMD